MKKARKKVLDERIVKIRKEKENAIKSLRTNAQNVLYWLTLMIMLIANVFIALILIPVLLVASSLFAAVTIALLGLLFGIIFNHLIRDIEGLQKHHHLFAGIFIPGIAVIDLFIITRLTNKLAVVLNMPGRDDSFILSLVFVALFLLPYLIGHLLRKK